MKINPVIPACRKESQKYQILTHSKSVLIILIILSFNFINSAAQRGLSVYLEAGNINPDHGITFRTGSTGKFNFGRNLLAVGTRFDLKNTGTEGFSGISLAAKREIFMKPFRCDLSGFFIETLHSDILRITDYGVLLTAHSKHIDLTFGTGFKIYAFSQKSRSAYNMDGTVSNIKENFNLLYSISCHIKNSGSKWDAGISIADLDYFEINQSTNPSFSIFTQFKLNELLSLSVQAMCKTAGLINMHCDIFGYFLRTGISWNF